MSIDTTRFKLELRFLILEDLMAIFSHGCARPNGRA